MSSMISISVFHVWSNWLFKIWSLLRSLLFSFIFKTSNISGDRRRHHEICVSRGLGFTFSKELIISECYVLNIFIFRSLRRRLRIMLLLIISTDFPSCTSLLVYSINHLIDLFSMWQFNCGYWGGKFIKIILVICLQEKQGKRYIIN